MNISTQKTPDLPDDLETALLLVSREFDGDLDATEASVLASLESAWPKEVAQFRSECGRIRNAMVAFPVVAMPLDAFCRASVPVEAMSRTSVEPHQPTSASPVLQSRRSGAYKLVVSVVTSVLCGALLLALNQKNESPDNTVVSADFENSANARGIGTAPDAAMAMEIADAPAMMAAPASEALAMAWDSTEAGAEHDAAAVSESAIEPLLDSDHWNVVVVDLVGADRDSAMDRIQQIVQMHGLKVTRSGGDNAPEWLGVVLTSAVDHRDEIVSSMEQGLNKPAAASTRLTEADAKTKEIVSIVEESLRFPTRSELHHGRIMLALPMAPAEASSIAATTRRISPESTANSNDKAAHDAKSGNVLAAKTVAPVEKRDSELASEVTLILFRFNVAEDHARGIDPI